MMAALVIAAMLAAENGAIVARAATRLLPHNWKGRRLLQKVPLGIIIAVISFVTFMLVVDADWVIAIRALVMVLLGFALDVGLLFVVAGRSAMQPTNAFPAVGISYLLVGCFILGTISLPFFVLGLTEGMRMLLHLL